ncbi:MAG: DNA repair protein RecN [Blastocatellia bacterium]|nr:DNA repair protein RecN [Blastocatellia bacterium]
MPGLGDAKPFDTGTGADFPSFECMLKCLHIVNFALVDQLGIEFGPGLNVLTGETGSGKSIVVDALGLVLGGRFSPEMIRSGETKSYVEALFSLPNRTEVVELGASHGVDVDPEEILIRREVTAPGRGRVFVNNQLATVQFLKLLRPFLVDIHGQGDQQSLLQPAAQADALDRFGGLEELVAGVGEAFLRWQSVRSELISFQAHESDRLRRIDMLAFQKQEIMGVRLGSPEEDLELEAERNLLANAERLASLANGAYQVLYEDESSVVTRMVGVSRKLDELMAIDASTQEALGGMDSVRYAIEDIAFFLRDYAERIHFSPDRHKEVEDRLAELQRLKRKYGPSLRDVQATLQAINQELGKLDVGEDHIRRLEQAVIDAQEVYLRKAHHLSRQRHEAARRFEAALTGELQYLAMEGTAVEVRVATDDRETVAQVKGIDTVEFFLSANVGEEVRSLAKVASGGEISRFMLALKTITAPTDFPRTMVFDEVDVGIGGRVAETVGQRLQRLGDRQQVLCVTHLPQIAAKGGTHFVVSKATIGNRTATSVTPLNKVERVEELARMIGGTIPTDAIRRTAREMLGRAEKEKKGEGGKG